MDGQPCDESTIMFEVSDKPTVDEMEITLICNRVGRVVSFEIPPDANEAATLTLCEVQVYGFPQIPGC